MYWSYDCHWQSDIVYTKESVLPVCDKPYHTNKRKVQKRERILRNCALLIRATVIQAPTKSTHVSSSIGLSLVNILSIISHSTTIKKLMKGKALRKHSLHEKTSASFLLKLFISSNEWCHTTDAPKRMSGTPFANVNNIHVHSMITEDQKKYEYTMM